MNKNNIEVSTTTINGKQYRMLVSPTMFGIQRFEEYKDVLVPDIHLWLWQWIPMTDTLFAYAVGKILQERQAIERERAATVRGA